MNRPLFLTLQALHITLYFLAVRSGDFAGMAVSGAIVILLQGLLIYHEIRYGDWAATPLVAYLTISTVRVGAASMYLAFAYMTGHSEEMEFISFDAEAFATRGHLLLMAGDWLFYAGYFAVEILFRKRGRSMASITERTGRSVLLIAFMLLALGWALRIGGRFGVDLRALGSINSLLALFSIPAGLFLLMVEAGRRKISERALVIAIAVGVLGLELIVALRSYMKQDMMLALLPVAVYFAERIRGSSFLRNMLRWQRLVPLLMLAYFVVMVLFPYNNVRRQMIQRYGEGVPVLGVLQESLLSAVPFTTAFSETHAFPKGGAWTFLARNEWTTAAAWAVDRVANEGTIGGQTILDGFVAIVPRIFWPEKPVIMPGSEFTVLMGLARTAETATTATGLGLAATLYWNGHIPGVVLGMLINGALLAITWRLVGPRILTNPVATIVFFHLFLESLRWFEGQFDGSLAFYAYIWIVFIPAMYLVEIVLPRGIAGVHLWPRVPRRSDA